MSTKKFLATAVLGSLLGSVALNLYPRRKEIFDALSEQSGDLKERSQDYAEELLRKGLAIARLRRVEEGNISWKSALAGLLLGAGAAILLAPKSGRETRKEVQRLYKKISGRTNDAIREFKIPSATPYHDAETSIHPKKKKKVTAAKSHL